MSLTSPHIRFQQLADLAENRLLPDEEALLQAHLGQCPRCTSDLVWLQRVLGLMQTDETEDAPALAVADVLRLFRPPASPGLRQRILAALRFDSAQLPLAFGMRTGPSAERQLLFGAEAHDLDVRVAPAGEAWRVSGQVLGPEATGEVLLEGPGGEAHGKLDDLGMFSLAPVLAGSYTLIVQLPEVELEVPGLELGS